MMKKDAYYFSHDSNARNDEKILDLRMEHGWEGYGIYWAIIEMLRDANGFKMRTDYKRISFALQIDSERIKSIIEDFNLFIINGEHFSSESLNKRMAIKKEKSKKAKDAAMIRWGTKDKQDKYELVDEERVETLANAKTNANALQKDCNTNASKVKESKVNYIFYESESDFLMDWKKARESIDGNQTNIAKLTTLERYDFLKIKDIYPKEQIRLAMKGLFKQKAMFPATKLRPTHFLSEGNIDKYLDAFNNKSQIYNSKAGQL